MRRLAAGEYATLDGRWRVVRAWGERSGSRARVWTVLRVDVDTAEVLDAFGTLRDARAWVDARGGDQ